MHRIIRIHMAVGRKPERYCVAKKNGATFSGQNKNRNVIWQPFPGGNPKRTPLQPQDLTVAVLG